MEPHQVDILAGAVFCNLQQIRAALEAGFHCQIRGDVLQGDLLDGIDDDFTFVHPVAPADLYARIFPDADAACDESAPYSFAKAFRENHGRQIQATLASMRHALLPALLLTTFAYSLHAQASDTFEVALVRPSGPDSTFRSSLDASQFIASHHTLSMLIASSYPELPSWRMSGGPSWIATDFWDFVGKLPPGIPSEQEPLYRRTEQMLRTFLAETFQLKTHFEQREQPVYELVAAKSGPKLLSSGAAQFGFRATSRGVEFRHVTTEQLAKFLYCPGCARQAADRPVFDKTGLTGFYDFTLNWAPSNLPENSVAEASIFTALEEQLGLKLQPQRAPIDFLVIDHAERPRQN